MVAAGGPQTASPIQIAVYISGHGYGHLTRTLNLISLLSSIPRYNFHVRTTSPLYVEHLKHALHPTVLQINPYRLDGGKSLDSLLSFDATLAQTEETKFLQQNKIQVILSDALSLPCQLGKMLGIPSILVTNFTFDSIFQSLLDDAQDYPHKEAAQMKINEMIQHYGYSYAVVRLPGYIDFLFSGPQIIGAPIHFRKAKLNREEALAELGFLSLSEKKIVLHCFGGHSLDAPDTVPKLPDGWVCLSQTIDRPPSFHKIGQNLYMPDVIAACDAVLGKLGWGTCCEVIGNGYKPFIYVPRSAFMEERGLLKWMETDHQKLVRLEVEDYESSDWLQAIRQAEKLGLIPSDKQEDWGRNEEELVQVLADTIENALV